MIAPLRSPEPQRPWRTRRPSATLRKARQLVAEKLLPRREEHSGPLVPVWKAWLVAIWMCAILMAFIWTWWRSRL